MKIHFILGFVLLLGCQAKLADKDSIKKADSNLSTQIGSQSFRWTDSNRTDDYYGGQRLVNVQVWYPAASKPDAGNAPNMPYYYGIEEAYSQLSNWSEADLEEVNAIATKSVEGLAVKKAENQYPLILFSPSLGGHMSHYTYYAEELAQAGFIVAAVNHLYESAFVLDEAGGVYPAKHSFHDSLKTLEIPDQITADQYRAIMGQRQKVLGEDLLFVLDQLLAINDEQFNGMIHPEKIGTFGHSIGGAAAIYAAYLDDRVQVVLNLDGTPPSIALQEGIAAPFMFIEDLTDYENHPGYQKLHARRSAFCEKVRGDAYRILISDINHNSFLDTNFHFAEGDLERLEAMEVLQQTSYYVKGFFQAHLMNQPFALSPSKTDTLEVLVFP